MGLRSSFSDIRETLNQTPAEGQAVVNQLALSPSTQQAVPEFGGLSDQQMIQLIQQERQAPNQQDSERAQEVVILQGKAAQQQKQVFNAFKKLRETIRQLEDLDSGL